MFTCTPLLGESKACLTGEIDGMPFEGCDTVLVVLPPGDALGAELSLLLVPVMWLYGRRRRRIQLRNTLLFRHALASVGA